MLPFAALPQSFPPRLLSDLAIGAGQYAMGMPSARGHRATHSRDAAHRCASVMAGRVVRPGQDDERNHFLLLGLWPAGVLPDENGEGVAPPFLMFLSAFGFFFSLLLRICPLAMTFLPGARLKDVARAHDIKCADVCMQGSGRGSLAPPSVRRSPDAAQRASGALLVRGPSCLAGGSRLCGAT